MLCALLSSECIKFLFHTCSRFKERMLLSSSTVLVLATFLLGVISLICRSLLWAVARQHFCTKINRPLQMFGKDHVHSNLKVPSMMVYHPT